MEDLCIKDDFGDILFKRHLTLSIAESCTGGLISSMITDTPGSSRYFLGGIVTYSNKSKIELLGVLSNTIEEFGAVSDQTVREMSEGVKKRFQSSIGIAVTGIAGPEGGSKEKPVGTVFLGMTVDNGVFSKRYQFKGSREKIKNETACMAITWIRRYLNGDSFLSGI